MSYDFPWRIYIEDELYEEYDRLKTKVNDKIDFPIYFSSIGFKCSNCFFQYERMNTPGIGRPSTIDYWNKSKQRIINFSKQQDRDYFSTCNYFNHAPSQFPIITAAKIYKYFGATKIFDPYAGWGDRCIAAMASNIDYTGIDCNKKLEDPYKELINFYPHNSKVNIIIGNSENINLNKIQFDFVLSSPPFWKRGKMLERYNDVEIEYNTFMEQSMIPMMKKLSKYDTWVCLYIPNDMYKDLVKIYGSCTKTLLFKTNRTTISELYCWKF
jgi:16S rRNA G966 N2-methylase RsmD